MEKIPLNSSSSAELEGFIQERLNHIEGSQSGSFESFWTGCEARFPDTSYAWRKELCLHMIERMLREDRCRLFPHSTDLGWLADRSVPYWQAPVEAIMAILRQHWARYENQPRDIHKPDGFDTNYFVLVVPSLEWPPYVGKDH
jgi:hypothetical protein